MWLCAGYNLTKRETGPTCFYLRSRKRAPSDRKERNGFDREGRHISIGHCKECPQAAEETSEGVHFRNSRRFRNGSNKRTCSCRSSSKKTCFFRAPSGVSPALLLPEFFCGHVTLEKTIRIGKSRRKVRTFRLGRPPAAPGPFGVLQRARMCSFLKWASVS